MTDADAPPDVPTVADAARTAAWETFGQVSKATTLTPTDRLRRLAEACFAAGDAYHAIRVFGEGDGRE